MVRKSLSIGLIGGAAALVALRGGNALAQSSPTKFDPTSTITLSHTDDIYNDAPNTFSVPLTGAQIPASSPAAFQLNHTFSTTTQTGPSSTVSDAAVYAITNLSNLSVALKAGSGITQTNVPGHAYQGPSNTDLNIDAIWDLGTSGFPTTGAFPGVNYQFALGGIVGISGMDEFSVNLTFSELSALGRPVQIGSLTVDKQFPNTTASPKAFTSNVAGSLLLNNGVHIPAGAKIILSGNIDFYATNDDSPSQFNLTQDSTIGFGDFTPDAAAPLPGSLYMGLAGIAGVLAFSLKSGRRLTAY
jgi:hypothetical protein